GEAAQIESEPSRSDDDLDDCQAAKDAACRVGDLTLAPIQRAYERGEGGREDVEVHDELRATCKGRGVGGRGWCSPRAAAAGARDIICSPVAAALICVSTRPVVARFWTREASSAWMSASCWLMSCSWRTWPVVESLDWERMFAMARLFASSVLIEAWARTAAF